MNSTAVRLAVVTLLGRLCTCGRHFISPSFVKLSIAANLVLESFCTYRWMLSNDFRRSQSRLKGLYSMKSAG